MIGQFELFELPVAGGRNSRLLRRVEDDGLRRLLSRRAIRVGYQAALAGNAERYLRKWSVSDQVYYELGRLLACELRAEFGAAPAWRVAGVYEPVVAVLIEWRRRYPGRTIVPVTGR